MEAIEFITKIHNGIIKIPKEYRESLRDRIRVIIMPDNKKTGISEKKFNALKLKTKDFKFDRDMANER